MTVCLYSVAVLCLSIFCSQSSYAESRYMSAVITGDNGEVDFSPGISDTVVDFSYAKSAAQAADSKIYDAKITLNNLPITSGQKKASITLPVGMLWVDDASKDENLLSQLDTSKGTNGVEKVALDQEPVLGYKFSNSGTRVYYFTEGSKAATINIKVRADSAVNLGYIEDAIVVKTEVDNELEEAHVDVNVPTGVSIGGLFFASDPVNYVGAGSTFSINKDYIRSARSHHVHTSYYAVTRLITRIRFTFHVDGNATIQLTSTDDEYSLDDSDAVNGNYVITYAPESAVTGSLTIPYSVSFPEDAVPGEIVTITATGETSFWQPEGPNITIAYNNSQNARYIIVSNEEDVTVGWNTLNPANSGSAHNISVNSPVRSVEQMTGALGYGYVNNRGNLDSAPKIAHMTFETDVLGVMMLRLPCSPSSSIESIHIKTVSGVDKSVAVNTSCNAYGMSDPISYKDLGIERDDYVAEVNYLLGVIPAATQLRNAAVSDGTRAFLFTGRRLDASRPGHATIEIFDADNPERTTGVATITSNASKDIGGFDVAKINSQIKTAGEGLSFSTTVSTYGVSNKGPGYIYGTETPIIYLRSEAKDAAGNFLPITNIKVKNGPSRGNQDITSLFGQITTVDTDTAKVYILDGRNVADGFANISSLTVSEDGEQSADQLIISFSIETSVTTPSQSHNISEMIFVQDPDDTSVTTNSVSGDPYGISIAGRGDMIRAATTNYYQIRQSASVLTENSGKHTSSDAWLTWSEGLNPITIGFVEGSAADMKVSLVNNSGVLISEPVTVYSPIPKKDQGWGTLSYDNQPFKFSTALTGAVANLDTEHFTIAYGRNVTPTDNGDAIENEEEKFTTDTTGWTDSDWQDVNCIKITATNIPANQPGSVDTYEFAYRLKVADLDSASDGLVNTWRPLFFQQLVNSSNDTFAGWYKGSYVSLQLANGLVSGEIFHDTNENGKKDTDEQNLQEAGWKIDLYDKISDRLVRSVETNADGQYSIVELIANPDSYYMVVTNKHPLGDTGTVYLFTQKGNTSSVGEYNTDNQAEGDRTSTPAHTTARIASVSPSQTPGEASYNIGVVEYVETTQYAGSIIFNDQDNKFGTRPSIVTLTANASDGSQHMVEINVLENGSFTADLPQYASTGDKLTYTFSSPDLANYDKTEQLTGNNFTLTYTQKTATLTVHHYEIGSTTQILPDNVDTVYYGQQYETQQGNVGTEYEFDSVEGENSGAVSGDVVVTYYYKKKINETPDEPETPEIPEVPTRVPMTVTVRFVDQDDNEIKAPELIEGFIGDNYDYSVPEINGYILEVDGGTNLVFAEDNQTVTFRYRPIALGVPDTSGRDGVGPNVGEVNISYMFTWGMCVFVSTSISLFILGAMRLRKNLKKN